MIDIPDIINGYPVGPIGRESYREGMWKKWMRFAGKRKVRRNHHGK